MSSLAVTAVDDGECLYRSVRDAPEHWHIEADGTLRVHAGAFSCAERRPSVDRATMRGHDPQRSLLGPDQGILTLLAGEVRGIRVDQLDAKQRVLVNHTVDVAHRPLPDNLAHAQVEAAPAIANKGTFNRLKERLAILAARNGWAVAPASLRRC